MFSLKNTVRPLYGLEFFFIFGAFSKDSPIPRVFYPGVSKINIKKYFFNALNYGFYLLQDRKPFKHFTLNAYKDAFKVAVSRDFSTDFYFMNQTPSGTE